MLRPEVIEALLIIGTWGVISILPLIIIIVAITKYVKSRNSHIDYITEKSMEVYRLKAEKDCPGGINPKHIVKCNYCGRQSRFGQGSCKYCGAELEYK